MKSPLALKYVQTFGLTKNKQILQALRRNQNMSIDNKHYNATSVYNKHILEYDMFERRR